MNDNTNTPLSNIKNNGHHLKIVIFACIVAVITIASVIGLIFIQTRESSRISSVANALSSSRQITTIKRIGALTNAVTTSIVDKTGYFTIKEWGIRYKIPDSISTINYKVQLNKTCWNADGQFVAPCSQIILTGALKGEDAEYKFSDITKCDLSYSLRSPINISLNGTFGGAAQSIALIGPNKYFVTDANSFEINQETGKCVTNTSNEYWSMQTVSTLLTRMLSNPEPIIPLDWNIHNEFKYGEGVPAPTADANKDTSNPTDNAGVAAPTQEEIDAWLGKQDNADNAKKIGDVNLDGTINYSDLETVQHWIGYSEGAVTAFSFDNADVNNDNVVNLLDGMILMGYLKGLTPKLPVSLSEYNPYGDINYDGKVNENDSVVLSQMINNHTAEWGQWDAADLNLDGTVDAKDKEIIDKYISKTAGYETLPIKS